MEDRYLKYLDKIQKIIKEIGKIEWMMINEIKKMYTVENCLWE